MHLGKEGVVNLRVLLEPVFRGILKEGMESWLESADDMVGYAVDEELETLPSFFNEVVIEAAGTK